jgi:putative peptidoglycan lipid II flippase
VIKKFFNNGILLNSEPSRSIISAAVVITLAGIASRILGLLRDRFLASAFGAGDTLDIYYAAFRVPDLIYNLLILGALSAAFIPVFTGLITQKEEKEAWKLANDLMNIAIILIVIFSLFFAVFAPFLMKLIAPGFPSEKINMAVFFTRIMFLSPLFLGISGIFGGILTSFKKFLIYSVAPIFYNLGIIAGVLCFVKFLGPVGLAWGVVFGAFLHMLIQYPAAKHVGFKYKPIFIKQIFQNHYLHKVVALMLPRMMGIAVNQINLFVITIFASFLSAGSLSILSFAQNMQSVPLGLFGVSFAIAVFPVLSAFAARDEKEEFVKAFSRTFCQILFFVVPLSVAILVLRAQLVRVILGAGKFDWEDTILTFQCLGVFSLSLFAQSTVPLLARAFYALHDTKTPFYIALFSEVAGIASVFLLINKFHVLGLAIAFSLASVVQMVSLLFVLRTRFDTLDDKKIINSVGKIALASFIAGISIQLVKYFTAAFVNMNYFFGVFVQLSISATIGALIFLMVCYFLRLEEFFVFKQSIAGKFFRGKQVITESTDQVSGI